MKLDKEFARYPSLRGRRVLITGGASGIGRAFVEAFLHQGAHTAFLDIDEESGSQLTAELAGAEKGNLYFLPCDVTDIGQLKTKIDQAVNNLGGLDVLINNAANDQRHKFDELTSEDWDRCMEVNLKHQFFTTQYSVPVLKKSKGASVICVGSIAWQNNTTGMVGYTTAKAGIHGLVRTMARLLGPHKIRVNALVPGWTMTQKQLDQWVDDDAEQEITMSQCLPDRVKPDDIARMALFLASDDSAMCTQQSFVVDGGWI